MYMFSKHGSTWSTDSTHNLSVSLKYKAWQAWLFTDNTAFILYYLFSGLTVACGLSETPCHTEGRPALWPSTRWHGLNWPRQHAWAIISLPKPHIKPCIARHCTDDKIFQDLSLFSPCFVYSMQITVEEPGSKAMLVVVNIFVLNHSLGQNWSGSIIMLDILTQLYCRPGGSYYWVWYGFGSTYRCIVVMQSMQSAENFLHLCFFICLDWLSLLCIALVTFLVSTLWPPHSWHSQFPSLPDWYWFCVLPYVL